MFVEFVYADFGLAFSPIHEHALVRGLGFRACVYLFPMFGVSKGFSEVNLKNARLFYNTYSKYMQKRQTVSAELQNGQKSQTLSGFLPKVSKNLIQQAFSAESDGYKTMQQAAQFFKLGWATY